jgi:hypothetical protein
LLRRYARRTFVHVKNLRWARPTSGKRGDILAWLRAQEAAAMGLSAKLPPISTTRMPTIR